jgi:hypothetical protein
MPLRFSSTARRSRPRQPDRDAGRAGQRLLHSVLLLAPQLSVAGNCRICVVEIEGRSWVDIACNMPVSEGMRVLTDSDKVRESRKDTMQFITLNHPVDCGICDKSGECTLQDYHYTYNGEPVDVARRQGHATKHFDLSSSASCSTTSAASCARAACASRARCPSHARWAFMERGDHSLIRPADDASFDDDPYSDNIIDICPVGALLSRDFLYKARVWYLEGNALGLPGLLPRLHHQDLAPQAGVAIQVPGRHVTTPPSTASRRWKIPPSTARGSATRAATSPASSNAPAPPSPCSRAGRPRWRTCWPPPAA